MKATELRQMTLVDLQTKLDGAKQEYFNLRFQRESGQLEDFNRLRYVRRDIARIMTLITEKTLETEEHGE